MPPEPFNASTWTAHIQGFAREARSLGWIKSNETLDKLAPLISALDVDKPRKLHKAVKKLAKVVLTEKKAGNLTDEADALIRLNAEYLLRRMTESHYPEVPP